MKKFPTEVYTRFTALIETLGEEGKLEAPFAKKLQGQEGLFEIRVKYKGQWRAIYAYLIGNVVIILSFFQKKTQKTLLKEIAKAKRRLQFYIK